MGDVRRLVVAMSRARLGLYVFARVSLFKNCFELQPAFNILMRRPLQLHLCPNEVVPSKRMASVTAPNPVIVYDMPIMSKFVVDFYQNKVKELKVLQSRHMMSRPGDIKGQETGKGVSRHPGEDRDSDDEAEGKNKYVEICNEVETEAKAEVSGENKAAQVLEQVLTQGEVEEEHNEAEKKDDVQMET